MARRRRRIFPAIDSFPGGVVFGLVAVPHECLCNPGATHLVFLTELAQAPRANQRYLGVAPGEVGSHRRVLLHAPP